MYNRLMIEVSTGTLYKLRIDLFKHMHTLPINFFDTHTHGELMSRFTNDIDAFRNMLSQSFVQLINSTITIVGVFFVMLALSPLLTLLVIIMLIIMFFTITIIGKGSRKFFMAQQSALGDMNGYIEEMMEGQKVVKVFNYEKRAKETFDNKNENLFENSRGAQALASMLRPIMGNLSYVLYAVIAMTGGLFSVTRGLDLGSLASFLQFTRSFSHPITQISEQFNSIILAILVRKEFFK